MAACCDGAQSATLSERAKESGCRGKPISMEGSAVYKCLTESGAYSYFNWPGGDGSPSPSGGVGTRPGSRTSVTAPSPTGFPRVDAATQKSRDDMRRKVLSDELASEEKLLNDARSAYGNGAPAPLPDEQKDADKYRQRLARLREAVQLHERNVEAIRKELGAVR
ncbi:MAG TPA: DUF4124 domain-containing protein [Casimicrobiaceae bacterium]|nr:DUF4124 domain-containing protein [Casimicrobiaceae bacterium]